MYPCKKQEVCAIIKSEKGEIVVGQNLISNKHVTECPRSQGEGYKKCINICLQFGHAEIEAIKNAKDRGFDLTKSILYLIGHTKPCHNCKIACEKEKLKVIVVEDK